MEMPAQGCLLAAAVAEWTRFAWYFETETRQHGQAVTFL